MGCSCRKGTTVIESQRAIQRNPPPKVKTVNLQDFKAFDPTLSLDKKPIKRVEHP